MFPTLYIKSYSANFYVNKPMIQRPTHYLEKFFRHTPRSNYRLLSLHFFFYICQTSLSVSPTLYLKSYSLNFYVNESIIQRPTHYLSKFFRHIPRSSYRLLSPHFYICQTSNFRYTHTVFEVLSFKFIFNITNHQTGKRPTHYSFFFFNPHILWVSLKRGLTLQLYD